MHYRRASRLLGAGTAATFLLGLVALPASALGNTSWTECFGGYAGTSWQSPANGQLWANTTQSGGCGTVWVGFSDYGVVRPNIGRQLTSNLVDMGYAGTSNLPTGGAHASSATGSKRTT